jgi:hypothetical protein
MMKIGEVKKLSTGDEVYWNDPDSGTCSRVYKIQSIAVEGTIVVIQDVDGSVLECFSRELA